MTGHLDGSGTGGNLNARNEQIRAYVRENGKVLFDFADIESYDPDGNYFLDRGADDGCNYDSGNWAVEWQDAHTEGVDWYSCSAAHTEPLNANLKAYAAWWLWARLGGWDGTTVTPTPTVTQTPEPTVTPDLPVALPGQSGIPTDPDSDGLYEDLNANGRTDFADLTAYFLQLEWIADNEPAGLFDFNGNGRIDFADLSALFMEL
jgi:PKD repeat protein